MAEKFGEAFQNIPFHLKGPGSAMMKEFECIKRDFGVSNFLDDTHEVTLVMRDVEESENYDPLTGQVKFDS
jgi:hypothetical protein